MKVLVTGGGGFLGQAIVRRLLDRGDDVVVLGRQDRPELRACGVTVWQGDVANLDVVLAASHGCNAIIHTAARIGSWGPDQPYHLTNVVGTENVIVACRHHGIDRLVFTSSPSVAYGPGDHEGIDESHPPPQRLDASYPRTKAIAEALVLNANDHHLATVALRPHLIWGPGDTQLLPRAIAQARAGKLRLIGGPPKRVDSLYIDNAADAHLSALDRLAPGSACAGRAYFISNGEPWPLNDLVLRMLDAAGVPPVRKTVAPGLLHLAGWISETIHRIFRVHSEPRVTRFVARQLTSAHWFDITAARRDLGYHPSVSMEEGLQRLRAWYQAGGGREV